MKHESNGARAVRFGAFELDLAAGELRKNGLRVRLQEQPFRLLALLVERPGEVVSREELREKLWPSDTYVDFDNSLNTAASKLREALGDSASSSRFIETLPRRGYRFLASVDGVRGVAQPSHTQQDSSAAVEGLADSTGHEVARRRLRRERTAWAAIVVGLVTLIAVLWLRPSSPSADLPVRKFTFRPAEAFSSPIISPNGRHISYVAGQTLWVQDLNQDEPRKLVEGGVRAEPVAWSSDSEALAYQSNDEIRRVPVHGGPSAIIYDVSVGTDVLRRARQPSTWQHVRATWGPEGSWIIFSGPGIGRPYDLYRVSSQGGTPELYFEQSSPEWPHRLAPHFLPLHGDAKAILYGQFRRETTEYQIVVRDLETGRENVLAVGRRPVYSPTGHVLYEATDRNNLWALPFSLETLRATGKPFPIRENASSPSVSLDGTLVYNAHSANFGVQLGWRDRSGNKLGLIAIAQPHEQIAYPAIAPDGERVALAGQEGGEEDIWIHQLERPVKTRATSAIGLDRGPVWTRNGTEILFSSTREGSWGIYLKPADRIDGENLLFSTEAQVFVSDTSSNGRYILYDSLEPGGPSDIRYLLRRPDGSFEAKPFLTTEFDEKAAKISPDGRWVVYVSDESGQFEIYVQRFPEGGAKQRISDHGGTGPRWSRNGRKLYYLQYDILIEVDVETGANLSVGSSRVLFQAPGFPFGTSAYPHYDVSADGERFVVRELVGEQSIRVVQNWFEEFKDKSEKKQ
jgi:Tol biopolymer transport system component/DNA-binding winged helix-turn-helix (wHTH) protein